jgi:glutathione synthase/RimK-type ligase-like ATP-grasp enzyme
MTPLPRRAPSPLGFESHQGALCDRQAGSGPRVSMARGSEPSILVVGIADERFLLLSAASERAGLVSPRVISYNQALANLAQHVDENTVLRFESTDEEPLALRACLLEGVDVVDVDAPRAARMSAEEVRAHTFQQGEILAMRQAYLGRCQIWQSIETQAKFLGVGTMNSAEALATVFDKRRTSARLSAASISVPTSLGVVNGFDDVMARIDQVPGRQVMVKTAHGAGATGIVALRTNGKQWQAFTTAVLEDTKLWNTRRVRSLSDVAEIRTLVDALCKHVVHVEHWIPKATTEHGPFDLRVVVIDGVARHVLMRSAKGPFTNLHLGARRGDVPALRHRLGEQTWDRIRALAEQAVAAIGGLLYAGVDVVVQSDWTTIAVLEINGFGDWHPDVFVDGMDTYDWELRALMRAHEQQRTSVSVGSGSL